MNLIIYLFKRFVNLEIRKSGGYTEILSNII